jgi:hypothetical protein
MIHIVLNAKKRIEAGQGMRAAVLDMPTVATGHPSHRSLG